MQRDSGQSAVPAEPGLPPPHGTDGLPAGSPMTQALHQDPASPPTQHIVPADQGDTKGQATEEQRYAIFPNEQKSQRRAEHPDLPFTETTKMLAARWAQLSREKKQRYIYEADEDKQRYILELQAYQSSQAYRAFLRRRAAHTAQALCGTPGSEFQSESLEFLAVDGEDSKGLHCRTCRQLFSSLHNRRGHLLSKQHLQTPAEEFERDSVECLKRMGPPQEEDSEGASGRPDLLPLGALVPRKSVAALDLCLWHEFISKVLKIKEFELRELRKTLERARAEQEALQRQLAEFRKQRQRLEVELVGLRTYRLVLEKEFANLNTVLMLSHLGLHLTDSGPQHTRCTEQRTPGTHHRHAAVTGTHTSGRRVEPGAQEPWRWEVWSRPCCPADGENPALLCLPSPPPPPD